MYLSKEEAQEKMNEISFIDLIKQVYEENPESPFHDMDAYMDMRDGSVFTKVMGKNESFQKPHFVLLYSLSGNFRADVGDDDIAGDDEIPPSGVEEFEDYHERVCECLMFYHFEAKERAKERIEDFYLNVVCA